MIPSEEIITGQSIAARCDYVFAQMHDTGKGGVPIFAKQPPTLNGGELVFCKTDYIGVFQTVLEKYVPKDTRFNLITHDSDYPITDEMFRVIQDKYPNITWWGMNSCSKFVNPIPIGIANSYCQITMKGKDFERSVSPTKLLYVNHRNETNPDVRIPAYKLFLEKSWATVHTPMEKGVIDSYKKTMLDHKFILCPRGNGIDTHRLWEALYCGVVPVVVRHRAHEWLEGNLPILFVDSYEEVNKEMLDRTHSEFANKTWNMGMLMVSWWMNRIRTA